MGILEEAIKRDPIGPQLLAGERVRGLLRQKTMPNASSPQAWRPRRRVLHSGAILVQLCVERAWPPR